MLDGRRLPWDEDDMFHALFETSPSALALSRLDDGRFVEVNARMCALYGFSRDEMIGRTSVELGIWQDPADRRPLREALAREGRMRDMELRMRRRDGTPLHVLTSIDVVTRGGESWMVSSNLDVTDRARLARELAQAREEIARKERVASLGTFVMGVAHEVNNPLMILRMNAQLAHRELAARDLADLARLQERSIAAIDRLARVGAGLEAIARLERSVGAMAPADPNALVRAALARVPAPHADRVATALEARGAVRADAEAVTLVAKTLVENALEASREAADATVRVRTRDEEASVVIEVEDHGKGIAAQDAARVFTPFFTTKHDGLGLALAAAYRIVGAHGGELAFESEAGRTRFVARLPRAA